MIITAGWQVHRDGTTAIGRIVNTLRHSLKQVKFGSMCSDSLDAGNGQPQGLFR